MASNDMLSGGRVGAEGASPPASPPQQYNTMRDAKAWVATCKELFEERYAKLPERLRYDRIWPEVWDVLPLGWRVIALVLPVETHGQIVIPEACQEPSTNVVVLNVSPQLLEPTVQERLTHPCLGHPLDMVGRCFAASLYGGQELMTSPYDKREFQQANYKQYRVDDLFDLYITYPRERKGPQ